MTSDRDVIAASFPHTLDQTGPGIPMEHVRRGVELAAMDTWTRDLSSYWHIQDTDQLGEGLGAVFDATVADDLYRRGLKADLFLGNGGSSLMQLRYMTERRPDARRGTLWFSTAFEHSQRVLEEEYQAWGIEREVIHPSTMHRCRHERDKSTFLIVPSETCKQTYPKGTRQKIRVAEFGVDSTTFHPPRKRDREHNRLKVFMPATNPIRKGFRFVSAALQELQASDFMLTATGPIQQSPFNQSHRSWVQTPGWVPDDQVPKMYRRHDVFLLPSLEEGQALATLEAAASGLPLIVTEQAGLPIEDGTHGIIVPARDQAAIADALTYLRDNPDERKAMGEAARKLAVNRPWNRFENRVRDILRDELET